MATEKKVLVLNPLTGELQQLQTGDTVFGLTNGQIAATDVALAAEATRATAAEATLQSNIDAEAAARVAGDATVQAAVDAEVTRAQAAEATLTSDLAAEVTRAQGAEATLTTNLAAEVTRAQAAEQTLTNNLAAEVTARQSADSALDTRVTALEASSGSYATAADLTAEVAARSAADTTLTNNLAAEVSRAQAAEATLQSNIDAEAAARAAADTTLQSNIDAEAAARAAADTTLTNNLAAEVTRAQAAEATLTSDLAAEVTRATAAEATLQSNIDAEAAARVAGDATVQAAVAAEVARATAAEGDLTALTTSNKTSLVAAVNEVKATAASDVASVQQAIANEVTRAQAAEATLTSDLAAEVTRAQAAEATLTSDLAAEVTARQAADVAEAAARVAGDATVQAAVDAEVTRAQAAEAALQTAVDGKVSKSGDTMTGPLVLAAAPTAALEAATKGYVDSLAGGLSWQEPVVGLGATLPATATAGDRFVNTTDGKIYTATAANTWDSGLAPQSGYALFDKSTDSGYVFNGSAWVQFTGTGQITAGLGLSKAGNVLNVDLAAGGALYFNPASEDNITTNSAIALRTGAGLTQDGSGLYIGAGQVTNAMLANSTITINGGSGSDVLALGDSLSVLGDAASGVSTVVDAVAGTLTISIADASATQKGVAKFDSNSFAVTSGSVDLKSVNGTTGQFGSSTAIPVLTVDDKGRVTNVSTAAISTEYSFVALDTSAAAVGDVVYASAAGVASKAKADASASAKAIGFVVADGQVATAGVVSVLTGLTAGKRYFVSDTTAGALIEEGSAAFTSLLSSSNWIAPVGVAVSSTKLSIQIGAAIGL